MRPVHDQIIGLLWSAWAIYWLWSASRVKKTRRRETAWSRAGHVVPLIAAGALLAAPTLPHCFVCGRAYPPSSLGYAIGAVIVAMGLGFAMWARAHLGGNWSGTVALKQDHELIRTGPYRLVRHPIYTGLLFALAGSAIALGEWRGWLAVLIAFVGIWRKLRIEERWMTEAFGAEYSRYRNEVAALIPRLL